MDPARCLFATDLHGREGRWSALIDEVRRLEPHGVFLGGDLLPHGAGGGWFQSWVTPRLEELKRALGPDYPTVFAILGNDDPRIAQNELVEAEADGLLHAAHGRRIPWLGWTVVGYGCVPPTPFGLKDWERYDVSRFVDPGSVSPEEGVRTVAVDADDIRHGTIARDLEDLGEGVAMETSVWLFHAPPYRTVLDRAALDGRMVDHVPLDVHVGSIAIRRFIEERQPRLTLHGHIHEAARITGRWHECIGATWCLGAAHDGPELAMVEVDLSRPELARRRLVGR